MDNHGGWAKFLWIEKRPLDCRASPKVLAYWIEKSESDPWTFDDLSHLVGAFLDSGDQIPTALEKWASEVAAKRRTRPARTGPTSDRTSDVRIALTALVCKKLFGMTQESVNKLRRPVRSLDSFKGALRRGRSFLGLI